MMLMMMMNIKFGYSIVLLMVYSLNYENGVVKIIFQLEE